MSAFSSKIFSNNQPKFLREEHSFPVPGSEKHRNSQTKGGPFEVHLLAYNKTLFVSPKIDVFIS